MLGAGNSSYGPDTVVVGEKTVTDFYQWAFSDFGSNALRGILAEFVVMNLLGLETPKTRQEWAPFDLEFDGNPIEIKFTSFVQGWDQNGKLSSGSFNISSRKSARLFIFCAHLETDRLRFNLFDLDKWGFFVVPTEVLNETLSNQGSVSLNVIQKRFPRISHVDLFKEVSGKLKYTAMR